LYFRISNFLNSNLSEEKLLELEKHLHIDNFKKNPAVNKEKWTTETGQVSSKVVFFNIFTVGTRNKANDGKHRMVPYCESFPYGES